MTEAMSMVKFSNKATKTKCNDWVRFRSLPFTSHENITIDYKTVAKIRLKSFTAGQFHANFFEIFKRQAQKTLTMNNVQSESSNFLKLFSALQPIQSIRVHYKPFLIFCFVAWLFSKLFKWNQINCWIFLMSKSRR